MLRTINSQTHLRRAVVVVIVTMRGCGSLPPLLAGEIDALVAELLHDSVDSSCTPCGCCEVRGERDMPITRGNKYFVVLEKLQFHFFPQPSNLEGMQVECESARDSLVSESVV